MDGSGEIAGLAESCGVEGEDMEGRWSRGGLDDAIVLCEHPEVAVVVKRDVIAVAELCVSDARKLLPLRAFLVRVDSADALTCRRPDTAVSGDPG